MSPDLENIYNLQIKRQIILSNILHEEKHALQIAKQRELSAWELLSGLSFAAILAFASQTTKNRLLIIPVAPLIMMCGYRFEQCFCQNASEIKKRAEEILASEEGINQIKLIGPSITLNELDIRRHRKLINQTNLIKIDKN